MVNTKEGGENMRQTMIRKHGSEAAWRLHMSRIGKIGGAKTTGAKGFALMDDEKRRAAGRKGGRISRRPEKLNELQNKVKDEFNG